jgi:ABC-2 type transport system ATP-binding protein
MYYSFYLNELEKITDAVMLMKNGIIESTLSMDDATNQYKKVQVVFNDGIPTKLKNLTNVEIVHQVGRVSTIVIKGDASHTLSLFKAEKPVVMEELPLSLEDIFLLEMGG